MSRGSSPSALGGCAFCDQRSLSENQNKEAADKYKQEVLASGNREAIAHFHSMDDDKSGNWLDALPGREAFRIMNAEAWLYIAMRRLMLPICKDLDGKRCQCGMTIDMHGDHAMVCNRTREFHARHESVLDEIYACAKSADQKPAKAWRGMYPGSDKVWDIIFRKIRGRPGVYLGADLSITSATCSSNLCAAQNPDGAAKERERDKNEKYLPVHAPGYEFTPLVLEADGRWGPAMTTWWNKLLKSLQPNQVLLSQSDTHWNAPSFKRYWGQRISLNLQASNGRILQTALMAARHRVHTTPPTPPRHPQSVADILFEEVDLDELD